MDDRQAIAAAKAFVGDVYAEEGIGALRIEEFEHSSSAGSWVVTLSFARTWDAPRTRAQEVLEKLVAETPVQRFFKVVTIADDVTIMSLKDRVVRPIAAE